MGIPLETYEYNDSGGGLDEISSPTKGSEDISTVGTINVEFDTDGSVRTRDGSSIFNKGHQILGSSDEPLKSLATFDFRKSDGNNYQILCNGKKIYLNLNNPVVTYDGLTSEERPDIEFHVTNDDEYIIYGNGVDDNLKFNGSEWTKLSITAPTAMSVSSIGHGVLPTGDYEWYVTYVREKGGVIVQESDMSPLLKYSHLGESDTGQATSGTISSITDTTKMLISSTATSGGSNYLTDTNLYLPLNMFVGYYVNIVGGTGSGQSRKIVGNTSDTFTVETNWVTPPNETSTYQISKWGTNLWAGKTVYISSGTGSGQTATIASNNSTTLTFSAPVSVAPDSTSEYTINTISITLSVPTSSDPQVTGRCIYRKNLTTGVFYRITASTTIDNVVATYTDNTSDDDLSTVEAEFDNQEAPKSSIFEEFEGCIYYRDEESKTDFLVSKPNKGWNVPYTSRQILDGNITAMRRCYNVLVIGTDRSIWTIDKDANLRRVSSTVGILNNRSLDGETSLYFVANNFAVYRIEPTQLVQDNLTFGEPLSRLVGESFDDVSKGQYSEISLKMFVKANISKVVISVPSGLSTSNKLYILNVKQSLAKGKPVWQIWDNINASTLNVFYINNEAELVSGDYNGFYWKLHNNSMRGDGAEMNGISTGSNTDTTLNDTTQIKDSGTATSGTVDTLTDSTKIKDTGTATGGTAYSIIDTTKSWTPDEFVGLYVNIIGGTGAGKTTQVISNTENTLNFLIAITPPDVTTQYEISEWRTNRWNLRQIYIKSGTGSGQYALVASNNGDTITFATPMAIAPDATSVYSLGGWPINDYKGINVLITNGKGKGQKRTILSNDDSQLVLSSSWTEIPDETSEYSIGGYTSRFFSNWKKVSESYEVLKQLWYMWCNANSTGDYLIKMILQFDFDTSLINQVETLINLKSENTIWGSFIWGEAIWGSRSVFLDRFRLNNKFRSVRIGFEHSVAGQPFQINNYGMSVQRKGLFWKNYLT